MISKKSVQCVIDLHKNSMNFDVKALERQNLKGDLNMAQYYKGRIDSLKSLIADLEDIIND